MKAINSLSRLALLSILIVSLSSCLKYEEVTITDVKSIKLIEFSDKGLIVESQVQLNNPNNYDLSVVESDFNVSIKNKEIASASIDNKISIPKNSSDYHKLILKSDYEDLADGALANMMLLTLGKDKIDFKVEGYIVGKAYFIKKKVKVSHEGKVPLELF